MQSAGWELSVDTQRSMNRDTLQIRMAGKHRALNLMLLSGIAEVPTELMSRAHHGRDPSAFLRYFEHLEIPIKCFAHSVTIPLYGTPKFQAVNFMDFGMRELDPGTIRQFSLEDLCIFKTFDNETELFVPEKKIIDVQEYLKDILISQEDKQREIRQKFLREGDRLTSQHFKNEMQEAPKLRLVGY